MNKQRVNTPFVGKAITANEDGLWPEQQTSAAEMLKRNSAFINYMYFSNTPQWQSLQGLKSLLDWYHSNPVFFATVMIKAREYANLRIKVVSRWDEEKVEPETTRKEIPARIYALFNKPNVLQSRWEFFMQRKIFEEVCGNSFTYGNFAMGFSNSIKTISALWNVWPSHMNFKLGGNYFEATDISQVVSEWKFKMGTYEKVWSANEIMHKNKPNTNVTDGLIFGRSPACSLIRPLTNIDMGYESRNVIMKNRGMRVILTSAKEDASGQIPLNDTEKDVVQNQLKGYGMLEGQEQFWFSNMPLNAVPIDQDVMKLGLFEEISTDAMIVANAYGVPEVLLKLYIKGATFENQEASVRRLYQGTLIPEMEDDIIALNSFLGLDQTDWKIVGSFDHVACLQVSEKVKADADKVLKDTAMAEVKSKLISPQEYRDRMGYGPMPVIAPDPAPEPPPITE